VDSKLFTPAQVASAAKKTSSYSIAYTYTEPVVFYEYMYDCAQASRKLGVKNVMISNGYIQEKPLRELLKILDGVKIDLKAFTNSFYKEMCNGDLMPVLNTLKILKEVGIWFEIVVLIIPTKNDSPKEIRNLCKWITDNLNDSVPVHFTRFHPVYKVKDIPSTPQSTLIRAYDIAKEEGIKFPYVGNIPGNDGENTYCPECEKKIIARSGFFVYKIGVVDGKCPSCKAPIPGVWK